MIQKYYVGVLKKLQLHVITVHKIGDFCKMTVMKALKIKNERKLKIGSFLSIIFNPWKRHANKISFSW